MTYRNQLLIGDCLTQLRLLPSDSVHCCVTSPPYWGLRDYLGNRKWFDESPSCPHENLKTIGPHHKGQVDQTKFSKKESAWFGQVATTEVCLDCGGWKGQLGLEATPDGYIRHLTDIFREVRRILHPSGTLWLNLGDSYSSSAEGEGIDSGLPPKNLLGIPWRAAIALQQDGWILRSEVIWAKPNCMPESVKDRPTDSHEHIFLLTKSPSYYYNSVSIEEQKVDGSGGRNRRSVWTIPIKAYRGFHSAVFPEDLPMYCIKAGTSSFGACKKCGTPYTEKGASCSCQEGSELCVVLDPFAGSGTTLAVAHALLRDFIGIEINPECQALIQDRLESSGGDEERTLKSFEDAMSDPAV